MKLIFTKIITGVKGYIFWKNLIKFSGLYTAYLECGSILYEQQGSLPLSRMCSVFFLYDLRRNQLLDVALRFFFSFRFALLTLILFHLLDFLSHRRVLAVNIADLLGLFGARVQRQNLVFELVLELGWDVRLLDDLVNRYLRALDVGFEVRLFRPERAFKSKPLVVHFSVEHFILAGSSEPGSRRLSVVARRCADLCVSVATWCCLCTTGQSLWWLYLFNSILGSLDFCIHSMRSLALHSRYKNSWGSRYFVSLGSYMLSILVFCRLFVAVKLVASHVDPCVHQLGLRHRFVGQSERLRDFGCVELDAFSDFGFFASKRKCSDAFFDLLVC